MTNGLTKNTPYYLNHTQKTSNVTKSLFQACWVIISILATYQMSYPKLEIKTVEYISNAGVVNAQSNAKKSFTVGKDVADGIDGYMIHAPNVVPRKGYRFKTPCNHDAFYFESENGDPFLIDDANNLWTWAGIDSENPADDWLVRTPGGSILNFFVDGSGKLQSNFIGHEEDMRVLSKTNLGTIVGFVGDAITDMHFKDIPSPSFEYYDLGGQEQFIMPPSLLEEGFLEFSDENHIQKKEEKRVHGKLENYKGYSYVSGPKQDPIGEFIEFQKGDGLNGQDITSQVKNSIESISMLRGIDVEDLPQALDYARTR